MTIHYEDDTITLHHGDALECARTLADRSVQTIITSPPYFGLRDYGVEGQVGSEDSVHDYIETMRALFSELRRALADDGTLWLNLGDSYASKTRGTDLGWDKSRLTNPGGVQKAQHASLRKEGQKQRGIIDGIPEKNMIGVPWRVAFALQDDGWILRSDIIWAKPNPVPESVTDRPTKAHEYLFLLAKSPRYFYDHEAIKEPAVIGFNGSEFHTGKTGDHQLGRASKQPRFGGAKQAGGRTYSGNEYAPSGLANKRTVWNVSTVPFSEAHFAVYPPELIRPCVLAGSRAGDVVLDPFSGSGTTGMVATQEGRKYIGFDLNAEYLDLSLRTRFAQPTLGIA